MMKPIRYISLSCLLCFHGYSMAQNIELSRQVIGSIGGQASILSNGDVAFTAGEAVVESISSASYTLTQGFHQPFSTGALAFDLEIANTSCPTSSDGEASVLNIRGCSPPYVVSWSNGAIGLQNDRLTSGFNTVTVSTADCELTLEFEVMADPDGNCMLRFFNAFSPNGDGINDTWEIENIALPEFSQNRVEIFNRWGQSIFRVDNYDNQERVWDGSAPNGKALPTGTYYFIAEVAGLTHKGYIELTK